MHILSIRPAKPGGKAIAFFDAEVSPGIRMFDLALRRGADGGLRVYAPNAFGRHCASFSADVVDELSALAHEELCPDDRARQ
jgi:hypothetical protein